ncbi:MAG: GIY-YIG nuclease family protein [Alphaproteobacteria bacterium]
MHFVYILQSLENPDRFYIGETACLDKRLYEHNSGFSIHTNKFKPWKIRTYFAFDDVLRAKEFEAYLKTRSGRAFAKKRF